MRALVDAVARPPRCSCMRRQILGVLALRNSVHLLMIRRHAALCPRPTKAGRWAAGSSSAGYVQSAADSAPQRAPAAGAAGCAARRVAARSYTAAITPPSRLGRRHDRLRGLTMPLPAVARCAGRPSASACRLPAPIQQRQRRPSSSDRRAAPVEQRPGRPSSRDGPLGHGAAR